MIDVCTTATCRPELLDRTFSSFISNLRNFRPDDSILYINIDPLPSGCDPLLTLDVAKKYFTNISARLPDSPNFSEAVRWVFSATQNQYVLNLQDDWLLKKVIDIQDMLDVMSELPADIVQIKFDPKLNEMISLSPSIMRGSFCRSIATTLDTCVGPERQLNTEPNLRAISWTYDPKNIMDRDDVIEDIGRPWRYSRGIDRRADSLFLSWQSGVEITANAIRDSYGETPIYVNNKVAITIDEYVQTCRSYQNQRNSPFSVLKLIETILSKVSPKRVLSVQNECIERMLHAYPNGVSHYYDRDKLVEKYDLIILSLDRCDSILERAHESSIIILLSNNLIPLLRVKARYKGIITGIFNPLFINAWEMSLAFIPTEYVGVLQ